MPKQATEQPSFEAGLAELEAVVKELETEGLPLERSIQIFEKGVALNARCRSLLEAAESRIEILTKKGDKIVPEPFEAE